MTEQLFKAIMKLVIVNPDKGSKEKRDLKYEVTIVKDTEAHYGNGCYFTAHRLDDCDNIVDKQLIDLRYDTRFSSFIQNRTIGAWIAEWAYSNWSGVNGSWKVKKLTLDEKISK